MTFSVVRMPWIRVVTALAFAFWILATAVPNCHVFADAAVPHAHIESSTPTTVSSTVTTAVAALHQHVGTPERHLPGDLVLAALPRAAALTALLLIAAALMLPPPMTPRPALGVRAPPVACLPVRAGRAKLTLLGVDRN